MKNKIHDRRETWIACVGGNERPKTESTFFLRCTLVRSFYVLNKRASKLTQIALVLVQRHADLRSFCGRNDPRDRILVLLADKHQIEKSDNMN